APLAGVRAEPVTKFITAPSQPTAVAGRPTTIAQTIYAAPVKKAPRLIAQAPQTRRTEPIPALAPAANDPATGTFSGTVTDPSGAVVPNARVLVTLMPEDDNGKPVNYSTVSGPLGQWTLGGLPVGRYSIDVAVPGFASVHRNFVTEQLGFRWENNTRLTLG